MVYVFDHNDPWFELDVSGGGYEAVELTYEIVQMNSEMAGDILGALK